MSKNTFKTFILLTGFGGLLMGIGSLFGTTGLVIGLGIALVFVGGSYWFSDTLAVKAAGAQPIAEPDAPELYAVVRELAQRGDIPMPRIYLSPAAQPNAFATGRGPDHAVVAVLSRSREFEKIEAYAKQVPMNVDPAQATAYVINPLSGRKASFANLFTTHPPTAERIARLRAPS